MKIAYIFFGQVKNFNDRQFYAFDQNVQSKLSAHNVDYFLTTSKHENYHNSRQSESEGGSRIIDPQSIQRFINFKSIFYDQIDCRDNSDIDKLAIDLVDQFGGAWGEDSIDSTKNSLRQIYSLEFFYNQFIKCGFQYDAFILSRSDLFHTHPLSVDCLHKDCDIAAPYFDDYPQIDYGWFGGINDRFAVIKNNQALKTYCTRYSRIKNQPQFYHAEKYLMNCIKQDNLVVEKIHNFEFRLLRANDAITDQIGIYPDVQFNTQLNKISKSYFINLDRRLDRLQHIRKNLPFEAQRFSAIDSKQIELNDEVKKLFPKTWHKKKKAEICCAISHYRLWKQLVLDKNADNYLILEDDVVFKPGFEKFWNEIFSTQFPEQYYLIYLGGCQPWNKPHYNKALSRYNDYFCTIKKNDYFTKDDYFWHMNASSYVLSKQGASLLCQWVDQVGMDEALDNFMQQFFNCNKMFSAPHMVIHANPLMAYQLHEENDNCELDKNSDLRFAEERFSQGANKCYFDIEGVEIILPGDNDSRHEFYRDFGERSGCEVILRSLIVYLYKQKFLDQSKSIIDLGAWIGDNALPWSKLISGNVYAIDPSSENIAYIEELKNLNDTKNLKTIKSAISDRDQTLYFSGDEKHITLKSKGEFAVNSRSLDSFLDEGLIDNVGFLHLDVEGQEHNVLLGSKTIISKFKPLIVWENHLSVDDYIATAKMLADLNYETFLINEKFPHCMPDCRNLLSVHKDELGRLKLEQLNHFFEKTMHKNKCNASEDLLIAFDLKKHLIPRTIFQTWETGDMGGFLQYLTQRMRARNSEYQYEFFDSQQRRNFIENNFDQKVLDCYDRIIPGAFKADLWRYCVLYKQGGIYCDIDMLAIDSFDYFILDGVDFFAPIDFPRQHRSSMLTNGMFGCVPGCEIMKNCIDIIVDNIQNNAWTASQTEDIIFDYLNFTGPGVLGRAVNKFLGRDEYSSFDKNYGIIEHKGKKIKLLEFSSGDEYIKDLNSRRVIQNKNGNAKVKKEVDAQIKGLGIKHWGEQLGLSRKPYQDDVCRINPSAVEYRGTKYVLYRTEIYPQDCPAYYKSSSGKRINFYRSDAGYQLQVGDNQAIDCDFVFDGYSYRTSRMLDLAGTNKLKIEDIRFIENTVERRDGEVSCLACCTILSNIDVFEGQKKEDGSWDGKKPIGLKLKTSPGICRVNLSAGKIQYIKTLSNESDDIQKNWLMFKHDDLYYCLYSMFPLLYCAHKSIDQIQFSQQEKSVSPKIHNATCPVRIDDNSYAMICHSCRQNVEQKPGSLPWAYKKYFVSFDLVDGEIANVYSQELDNIKPEYYCSSILKDGDQLKVFAGTEDVGCVEFNINIPRLKTSKTKNKLIFTQNNLFEQDFLLELFDDVEVVYDEQMNGVYENAVIVYSDIYHRDSNIYKNKAFRDILNEQKQKLFNFLDQQKNCCLVHLSDEHCHAKIDHYKNFKHVFRQYYRSDAIANNVTFIPLGCKSGFYDQ